MPKRNYPDYYYEMRDEILALMDDQAGIKPFDATNYRIQFRKVAAKHKIPATSYLAHFGIIQNMVAAKLPKMKPRQPRLV